MKLVEYESTGRPRLGAWIGGNILDVASLAPGLPFRMLDLIQRGPETLRQIHALLQRGPDAAPVSGRLLAPLPNGPKLLCVAANYREHIRESGFAMPTAQGKILPQFFAKFPSTCIIGPDAPIPLTARNTALDWEVELAVIVGKRVRNMSPDTALSAVFGYSIANDVSERSLNATVADRELRTNDSFFDWLGGKWFDGSLPLGPSIVTADEIADPQSLSIELRLDGEIMQQSNTQQMLFPVAELISYISHVVTLEPGDIIATGTPEGTGSKHGRFLRHGEMVRCEIARLGVLENPVQFVDRAL